MWPPDNDKIEVFSKKYIVSPDLVKQYLEHLTNIGRSEIHQGTGAS